MPRSLILFPFAPTCRWSVEEHDVATDRGRSLQRVQAWGVDLKPIHLR